MDKQAGCVDSTVSTPIVVDLDGTLTATDTLVESVIGLLRKSLLDALLLPFWLVKGLAAFKTAVAARTRVAADCLPYHEPFLTYLRGEKNEGRRIVLATAAHMTVALDVSRHLGLFDQVIATEAGRNLKGGAKLAAIRTSVGSDFVYAGDSPVDLPIWQAAQAAVLVGVSPRIARLVRSSVPVEREFARETAGFALWARALRVHQWLENLLLFVPMLTAFSLPSAAKMTTISVAFLAFSLAASATYVVNDICDLNSDRGHPRKRLRAFASARIPILHGLLVAALALAAAAGLAFMISNAFLAMLAAYLTITGAYSLFLKKYVLIDVLTLSLLYTMRILAGSVAVGISTSSWLIAFSAFIFLSLALVKRCAELVTLDQQGVKSTRGRDYRTTDLAVLWPLGVGTGVSAVVVFGLFISAPDTQSHYATPDLLWLAAVGLMYWIARLWLKTSRGEMHDDPVVYAVRNHGSRVTIFGVVVVMVMAHFIRVRIAP